MTVDGDRVRRALLRPPDTAVLVDVGPAPGGVDLIVSSSTALSSASVAAVEADVARWLGLADDLSGFHARAATDPPMAPVLEVARGLHQVRFPSLSEATVYFALTQRSTTWFARARKGAWPPRSAWRWSPTGSPIRRFRRWPRSPRCRSTRWSSSPATASGPSGFLGVARGVAALDESWLRTAPYDEARRALLAINGVGPFTAHGLLIRALGRPDEVPLEMAQFTQTAAAIYGEPPPSPAELRGRYGDQIGWWAYGDAHGAGVAARARVRTRPCPAATG